MKQELPYPKERKRLPIILSPDEVARLIDSARTLFHRTMLMTLYSAGLRRSELCRLKVADIDSQRMMLRVERGKGGVDREVPLSQKLLEMLRECYRWMRPKTYLFPGTINNWRVDKPITPKVVWMAVRESDRTAPGSRSASHLTRCGIVTRRTCSNPALISEPSNCSWARGYRGDNDLPAPFPEALAGGGESAGSTRGSPAARIERSRRRHKPA